MKIIKDQKHLYLSTENWSDTTFQPVADIKSSIRLHDGLIIQTAGFKILRGEKTEFHACVSVQAGCKFACRMCVSGKNGFTRNLTQNEIVEQVQHIAERFSVPTLDHVVFMGIGEPLDNYVQFTGALRNLNMLGYLDKLSFATIGGPKKIIQFANEKIPMRMMWISLHAPNEIKRKEIIPFAGNFTLKSLIEAGVLFHQKTNSEVRVNYLLYKSFNDSFSDAEQLVSLLDGTSSLITLQLTEPNDVDFLNYDRGDKSDIDRFKRYLLDAGLKNKIIRFLAAGRPLQAGCGEFAYISNK